MYVPFCETTTGIIWLTLDTQAQKVPELMDIVRIQSCSERDSQLIEVYAPVSEPLVHFPRVFAHFIC